MNDGSETGAASSSLHSWVPVEGAGEDLCVVPEGFSEGEAQSIGSPGESAREELWYAQAAEDEDPMPAIKRTKRNQAQLDPVPMLPPQHVKIAIWKYARRSAPKLPWETGAMRELFNDVPVIAAPVLEVPMLGKAEFVGHSSTHSSGNGEGSVWELRPHRVNHEPPRSQE